MSSHTVDTMCEFLVSSGAVPKDRMGLAKVVHDSLDRRFGQLAMFKGYLNLPRLHSLLKTQSLRPLRIGEAALEAGYMTAGEVEIVLRLQQDPALLFLETLVAAGLADEKQISAARGMLRARATPGPAESPPPNAEVRAVLARVKSLGTLPTVVQRVLALTDKPEVEIRELEQTVTADPSMTAQLLRLVNSAEYGAVRKITTARDAIRRIGAKGLRNVALTTVMLDRFRGADKDAMWRIWRHSVLTAQWARVLAAARGFRVLTEDSFVAGLVHDVGRTVLRQFFPDATAKLDACEHEGGNADAVEREAFGQTHADLGGYLCGLWSFPPSIVEAVAYHHLSPSLLQGLRDLSPVARFVNAGCRLAQAPLDPAKPEENRAEIEKLDEETRRTHGLDASHADLVPLVHEKLDELLRWVA